MRFSLLWLCGERFASDYKRSGAKLRRHKARKIIAPLHQTMILTLWACLWCWPCRGEAKMEYIAALPAPASAIFADDKGNLIVALTGSGGLGMLRDGAIEIIATGPVGGAAPGPQGGVYFTREGKVLYSDLQSATNPRDLCAAFEGPAQGAGRIVRTPDRSIWVEGCSKRRGADGAFHPVPPGPAPAPAPLVVDTYDNGWSLQREEDGSTRVLLLPAAVSRQWRILQVGEEPRVRPWTFVLADAVGYVWLADEDGLQRLDPHHPEAGWRQVPRQGGMPESEITALSRSPDDLALVGFVTGELIEADMDAAGKPLLRFLGKVPGAARALHTDSQGQIWVATDKSLYRQAASLEAWQRHWRPLARLPGGNHDLFAIELGGEMYMAGGLTAGWSFPARTHVFDELFAYDPSFDRWRIISRMPYPRCYNGIALLDGRIWIVGGAANLAEPENPDGKREPLDEVQIYDPQNGTWTPGPHLPERRIEPVVLAAAGRIYAIGGSNDAALASVVSIGPGERSWRSEASLPEPLNQAAGCVLDGVLYCIGRPGLFAFDPAQGAWLEGIPQLRESPQAPQVAAHAGEVWVMGGSKRQTTHIYNPRHRTWRQGPSLPTDQSWGAALDLDGRLIVAGGAHWSERHQTYIYDDRVFVLHSE